MASCGEKNTFMTSRGAVSFKTNCHNFFGFNSLTTLLEVWRTGGRGEQRGGTKHGTKYIISSGGQIGDAETLHDIKREVEVVPRRLPCGRHKL